MLENIELKPLRKNARNASYRVLTLDRSGSIVVAVTTYATIDEAVKHVLIAKNGDIINVAKNSNLKIYYSPYHDSIRFGHGATEIERCLWRKNFYGMI